MTETIDQDLQTIEKAITDKTNKLAMANSYSKIATNEDQRNHYKHIAGLLEGELEILNEGHARLSIKFTKSL